MITEGRLLRVGLLHRAAGRRKGSQGHLPVTPLLVVLKSDERRIIDRVPDYLREFLDALIPVDVFPFTLTELDRVRSSGNHFIERALREGVTPAGRST